MKNKIILFSLLCFCSSTYANASMTLQSLRLNLWHFGMDKKMDTLATGGIKFPALDASRNREETEINQMPVELELAIEGLHI